MPARLIRLTLSEISLWGRHGVEDSERTVGGPFLLTIAADCPATEDPLHDDLAGRLDYAALADRAVAIFHERRFALLEPLLERMAAALLDEFPLMVSVSLTLRKMRPMMKQELAYAEVSLERHR